MYESFEDYLEDEGVDLDKAVKSEIIYCAKDWEEEKNQRMHHVVAGLVALSSLLLVLLIVAVNAIK